MLRDLIQVQVDPYRTAGRSNVTIAGEDVSLEPDAALTLGLALHELATNAAKHGAFTCPAGRVEIRAQIHAALSYYYDHKPELDEKIVRDLEDANRLKAQAGDSPFVKRMRAEGKLR